MEVKQEKVIMEVTRGEAESILYDRLDNKWYVDLQPIFILFPGITISYGLYIWLSKYITEWQAIIATLPIFIVCFYILWLFIKRRNNKAKKLYEEMVKGDIARKLWPSK